jgi:NADPH:quinone reductase-like Zn-dependent oxidoreductase
LALPAASRSGVAGIVEAVAEGQAGFQPGDEVFGVTVPRLLSPGTEHAVLSASRLARKPDRLSFAQAASIPTAAVTAWQMLFEHGRLERGETVVVLGADRPVGALAVRLAREHGVRTVALASSRHAQALRALGADLVIDASPRVLEAACTYAGVVVDAAGGNALSRALGTLASGCMLVSSVARPGPALLASSRADFSLCVPNVTTLRLAQIAAMADRCTLEHLNAFRSLFLALPRRGITVPIGL